MRYSATQKKTMERIRTHHNFTFCQHSMWRTGHVRCRHGVWEWFYLFYFYQTTVYESDMRRYDGIRTVSDYSCQRVGMATVVKLKFIPMRTARVLFPWKNIMRNNTVKCPLKQSVQCQDQKASQNQLSLQLHFDLLLFIANRITLQQKVMSFTKTKDTHKRIDLRADQKFWHFSTSTHIFSCAPFSKRFSSVNIAFSTVSWTFLSLIAVQSL